MFDGLFEINTISELNSWISCHPESKKIDYKRNMDWDGIERQGQAKIIKAIDAMINTTNGGLLIIGIDNGTKEVIGLNPQELNSWDPTNVKQVLCHYLEPYHDCEIYNLKIEDHSLVVISITPFRDIPIKIKKSCKDGSKFIIEMGRLYIRTESAKNVEVEPSMEVMELFLNQKSMLQRILINKETSMDRYNNELEYLKNLKISNAYELDSFGHWKVIAHPVYYMENRIKTPADIHQMLKDSCIKAQDWCYPYIERSSKSGNFTKGVYHSLDYGINSEFHITFFSGLFFWKKCFREDFIKDQEVNGKRIERDNIITFITDLFEFLGNFYSRLEIKDKIFINLKLTDTADRTLVTRDANHPFITIDKYKCIEPELEFNFELSIEQLSLKFVDNARNIIRQIFNAYNNTSTTDEILINAQKIYLSNRNISPEYY